MEEIQEGERECPHVCLCMCMLCGVRTYVDMLVCAILHLIDWQGYS